jgi:TetR/AcrR family transcriptional repressor of nem operon
MNAAHELIWSYSYGSVTIEAICERAQVKKGSFYYFFDSNADLAVAAIKAWWDERLALVTKIFHPSVPPLDRIGQYIGRVVEHQLQIYAATGQILGCPLFTLGSEISTQDERLRTLVQEIMRTLVTRFESAIRDAQLAGDIDRVDPAMKARQVWAFYEGTLTRARIEKDPDLLRTLCSDALALVGPRSQLAVA